MSSCQGCPTGVKNSNAVSNHELLNKLKESRLVALYIRPDYASTDGYIPHFIGPETETFGFGSDRAKHSIDIALKFG
jgi:hypothetical protein